MITPTSGFIRRSLTQERAQQAEELALSCARGLGTIGARLRYGSTRRWHLFFKGDAGAGGSNFTWQVIGGGGYDLGSCCIARAAYRHLDVDYESADILTDVYLSGPALGLEIKF